MVRFPFAHHLHLQSTPRWLPAVACAVGCLLLLSVTASITVPPSQGAPSAGDMIAYPARWAFQTVHLSPPGWQRSVRTVAVVIDNHEFARPYHIGLGAALAVWEFPVESGISRFVAVFDADNLPERIGPVRSLRPYFVDSLEPWTTLLLHAGGSPEAFEHAEAAEGLTTINALLYRFEEFFERDLHVAAPHNLFTTRARITALLDGRSLPAQRWPPYDTGPIQGDDATAIHIDNFSRVHDVDFVYDETRRRYRRINDEYEADLEPRNVLILGIPIAGIGDYGRLTLPVTGTGDALLFHDGKVVQGVWDKADDESELQIDDANGHALGFATGSTWITVVPRITQVTVDL